MEGTRYRLNNIYSPADTSWIWHPYPYHPVSDSVWAEVMHMQDPFGDEKFGAWFMYSPGSGIYFNVGKSMAFQNHDDAYAYFGVHGGDYNEGLSVSAAGAGYDSLQFIGHVDHVNYPCDTGNTGNPGLDYMDIEILGVKLTGTFACAGNA